MEEFYIRAGTSAMFGTIGTILTLDPLHGQAGPALRKDAKYYPTWFPVCVGLWQVAIAAGNFPEKTGIANVMFAQTMQAILMGGAIHHHVIGEKKPAASVGALLFLGLSVAVAVLNGKKTPQDAAAQMTVAAAVGFGIGCVVKALNLGGDVKKEKK